MLLRFGSTVANPIWFVTPTISIGAVVRLCCGTLSPSSVAGCSLYPRLFRARVLPHIRMCLRNDNVMNVAISEIPLNPHRIRDGGRVRVGGGDNSIAMATNVIREQEQLE